MPTKPQRPLEQERVTLNDIIAIFVLGNLAASHAHTVRDAPNELVSIAYGVADAFVEEKDKRGQS